MFMQRSVFGSRLRSVNSDDIRKVHQHNSSFDRNYPVQQPLQVPVINKTKIIKLTDNLLFEPAYSQQTQSLLQAENSDSQLFNKTDPIILSQRGNNEDHQFSQQKPATNLARTDFISRQLMSDYQVARIKNHSCDIQMLPNRDELLKLPSYATCLKAQIKPGNFRLLKDYYELLAKDQKLALLNKDLMLSSTRIQQRQKLSQYSNESLQKIKQIEEDSIRHNQIQMQSQSFSLNVEMKEMSLLDDSQLVINHPLFQQPPDTAGTERRCSSVIFEKDEMVKSQEFQAPSSKKSVDIQKTEQSQNIQVNQTSISNQKQERNQDKLNLTEQILQEIAQNFKVSEEFEIKDVFSDYFEVIADKKSKPVLKTKLNKEKNKHFLLDYQHQAVQQNQKKRRFNPKLALLAQKQNFKKTMGELPKSPLSHLHKHKPVSSPNSSKLTNKGVMTENAGYTSDDLFDEPVSSTKNQNSQLSKICVRNVKSRAQSQEQFQSKELYSTCNKDVLSPMAMQFQKQVSPLEYSSPKNEKQMKLHLNLSKRQSQNLSVDYQENSEKESIFAQLKLLNQSVCNEEKSQQEKKQNQKVTQYILGQNSEQFVPHQRLQSRLPAQPYKKKKQLKEVDMTTGVVGLKPPQNYWKCMQSDMTQQAFDETKSFQIVVTNTVKELFKPIKKAPLSKMNHQRSLYSPDSFEDTSPRVKPSHVNQDFSSTKQFSLFCDAQKVNTENDLSQPIGESSSVSRSIYQAQLPSKNYDFLSNPYQEIKISDENQYCTSSETNQYISTERIHRDVLRTPVLVPRIKTVMPQMHRANNMIAIAETQTPIPINAIYADSQTQHPDYNTSQLNKLTRESKVSTANTISRRANVLLKPLQNQSYLKRQTFREYFIKEQSSQKMSQTLNNWRESDKRVSASVLLSCHSINVSHLLNNNLASQDISLPNSRFKMHLSKQQNEKSSNTDNDSQMKIQSHHGVLKQKLQVANNGMNQDITEMIDFQNEHIAKTAQNNIVQKSVCEKQVTKRDQFIKNILSEKRSISSQLLKPKQKAFTPVIKL